MGRGDYRWREVKKPKKGAKKSGGIAVLSSPASVEVIKKGRREKRGG